MQIDLVVHVLSFLENYATISLILWLSCTRYAAEFKIRYAGIHSLRAHALQVFTRIM
jgi:hypothetical protein